MADSLVLSIIIPVYNREICSLIHTIGHDQRVEYIIIDDGSPEPVQIAASEDVRVIRLDVNCGAGNARNVGLSNARGDYVAFVDSDDKLSDHFLAQFFELLDDKGNFEVLLYQLAEIRDGTIRRRPLKKADSNYFAKTLAGELMYISPVDKVFSRKFLLDNSITFPPTRGYEDVSFIRQVAYHVKNLRYSSKLCYYARLTENSVSRNNRSNLQNITTVLAHSNQLATTWELNGQEARLLKAADARLILYEMYRFAIRVDNFASYRIEHLELSKLLPLDRASCTMLKLKYWIVSVLARRAIVIYVSANLIDGFFGFLRQVRVRRR